MSRQTLALQNIIMRKHNEDGKTSTFSTLMDVGGRGTRSLASSYGRAHARRIHPRPDAIAAEILLDFQLIQCTGVSLSVDRITQSTL